MTQNARNTPEEQGRLKFGFWRKLLRHADKVPFAEDAIALYYCALDKQTPMMVRATLLAALAYFIMPADALPDILPLIGFSDDASVLAAAFMAVRSHVTERHRAAASGAMERLKSTPE